MPRKLPRGAAKAGTQKKSGPGTVNTDKVYNYRIAIDFGTTFTSVAFIRTDVQKVLTIENFPKDPAPDKNYTQVPTEIWYQHGAAKHAVPASATSPLPEVKCGYEARDHMRLPDAELTELGYRSDGYVTKPKLLLDQSTHLQEIQGNLMSVVRQLESNHLIKNGEDIIERLITYYLEHTKRVLIRDNNYSKDSDVEVTFCVPVCWSAAAVAVMSACVQKAMKSVGLGRNGIHKIFVVNEAEAAAMYVLSSDYVVINERETFVMLDCGGGTTDVGTYTIAHEFPLRLGQEVGHPNGAICGSGDLNDRMRTLAAVHLNRDAPDLGKLEGATIASIIESEIMPNFERNIKRHFKISDAPTERYVFVVRGLREHPQNPRIKTNRFMLTYDDMRSIFDESLEKIDTLMRDQIRHAWRNEKEIDKVVLVGGFSDSPALREYLGDSLQKLNKQAVHQGRQVDNIELVCSPINTGAASVAIGAVMRAMDKKNGPERTPRRSIGMLHHIPRNPEPGTYTSEVLSQSYTRAKVSDRDYIMNTIFWIIKAGKGKLSASHEETFVSEYEFYVDEPNWIAQEILFTSDTCVEDHYQKDHSKNRGKFSSFGEIDFDLNHLRKRITEEVKPEQTADGDKYYRIILSIEVKVTDRHLAFSASWPYNDENAKAIPGDHAGFDLSSIFKPGTA